MGSSHSRFGRGGGIKATMCEVAKVVIFLLDFSLGLRLIKIKVGVKYVSSG